MAEKANFARLNVMESKENRRLAIQLGVMGTPTIKVFCHALEVGEVVGLETLNDLEKTLENILFHCT